MQIHNFDKPGKIDLELARTQGRKKIKPERSFTMIRKAIDQITCKTGLKIMCIVSWGLAAFVVMYAVVEICSM